jgi:hypothetical protein
LAEGGVGGVEEPDVAGALVAFGRFGDDEGDATAVGRKFETRKMAEIEQRLWSERLGGRGGGLLGGVYRGKKRKTEKDGE